MVMKEPDSRTPGTDGDRLFLTRWLEQRLSSWLRDARTKLTRLPGYRLPFTFPHMTLMISQLWLLEMAAQVGEAPDSSVDTQHPAGTSRVRQQDIRSSGLGHSAPRLCIPGCFPSLSERLQKTRPLFPYRDKVQMDHDIYI